MVEFDIAIFGGELGTIIILMISSAESRMQFKTEQQFEILAVGNF